MFCLARTSDIVLYTEVQRTVDESGEIISSLTTQKVKDGKEPDYVKVYVDCLLSAKDLSQSLNPILLAFITRMSYANPDEINGGQVIYVNSAMKNDICLQLNIKIDRVNQSLQQFKKAGIFKSLARGKYQVNPNYFGRGEWKDIKKIKANFEFSSDGIEIITEIERIVSDND